MRSLSKKTLLDNASSGGVGPEFEVERAKGWTFYIDTTVQGIALVLIEAKVGGTWHIIHSQSVNGVTSYIVRDDQGHYEKIRASMPSGTYIGGTHSVYATGTVESL